jgi:hypothetical protein
VAAIDHISARVVARRTSCVSKSAGRVHVEAPFRWLPLLHRGLDEVLGEFHSLPRGSLSDLTAIRHLHHNRRTA